jgi:2Fe-2S ferredoxin
MIKIHFISIATDGSRSDTPLQIEPGCSLMDAASAAGIEGIAADCGGLLTCATCHVLVDEPWFAQLPPAKNEEQDMLAFVAVPLKDNSRLSCQIQLTEALDGLTVELPSTQY